jgi:hypothetical protein
VKACAEHFEIASRKKAYRDDALFNWHAVLHFIPMTRKRLARRECAADQ